MSIRKRSRFMPLLLLPAIALAAGRLAASPAPGQQPKLESCKPASERTGVEGCWILASARVGKLPEGPVFWTLDVYPNRESAQGALTSDSTLVEALGRVWLFTVGGKAKPTHAGSRVTEIGPLPVKPGEDYTAQYREAILASGAVSRTHLHSGAGGVLHGGW